MRPQRTQRAWGLAPASRAQRHRHLVRRARRPGARALSCRAASHGRCYSRACSSRLRCCGSHARSASDLHRWGHSAPSGPGGWRPPFELRTVAPSYLSPRCPGVRTLSCRAAALWRNFCRASSALSRCNGGHAWGTCDLHRWGHSTHSEPWGWRPPPVLSTVVSRCLPPCRLGARALSLLHRRTMAVLQPCLHRTLALLWQSREERE